MRAIERAGRPLSALISLAILTIGLATPSVAATAPPFGAWSDAALDVVGSPVAADGSILVLNVVNHKLELTAVRPSTGAQLWHQAFSASLITQGVAFSPVVLDHTVLTLSPVGNEDQVTVEGLNVGNGAVEWSLTKPILAADAPAVCAGGRDFCVAAYTQGDSTALVLVNATSGMVSVLPGPERNMGVAAPGAINSGDLWQTDAKNPTFTQVSPSGHQSWTKSVKALFGGSEYQPDEGWDFLLQRGVDIGSVGVAPSGKLIQLKNEKTVAISATSGSVAWTAAGDFMCGGPLQFLAADVICRYSGTVSTTHLVLPSTLDLAGLNTTTGATTWTHALVDAKSLASADGVVFADSTHLVVHQASGGIVVVNVVDGTTRAPGTNATFWCESTPSYTLTEPKGLSQTGTRASEPVFAGCSASGQARSGVPTSSPGSVGVSSSGMFVWPSPNGLRARPL